MNFLKMKETCLYINDLETAKNFYTEVLDLEIISYAPGKHLFLQAGASVLLLFNPKKSRLKKSPPAHYGGGKQHFAFEVSEADYLNTKAEIQAKEIVITDEVIWKSRKKSFYFCDPERNVLEILPDSGIWD